MHAAAEDEVASYIANVLMALGNTAVSVGGWMLGL